MKMELQQHRTEQGPGEGQIRSQLAHNVAAYRALLHATQQPDNVWGLNVEYILSSPALNWSHLADYICKCSLAHPLLSAFTDAGRRGLAAFDVVESVRVRARQDGIDELKQREAVMRIDSVLREFGTRGVLLKGSALLFATDSGASLPAHRSSGDIDIYVDSSVAFRLRARLLECGFKGTHAVNRTAPHHLSPLFFHAVCVEIHERIMPVFWGLPEEEMLNRILPVKQSDALYTLDAEGFLMHAVTHSATHLFCHGLKTAWDVLWVLRQSPELDWDRLAGWVTDSRLPRAFWAPFCVLSRELGFPVPAEFLSLTPYDKRQKKLEKVARDRLFSATEGPFDLNPFLKNWLILMLHDSWMDRVRYLFTLATGEAAEARRTVQSEVPSQSRKLLPKQLYQALFIGSETADKITLKDKTSNYVLYSTSNTHYQSWQCDLLEFSYVMTGQSGKLICLCSEGENGNLPPRASRVAEVVALPSYMKNDKTGDFWGIANKVCSLKAWIEDGSLEGSVMFVDPDMIFLDKIDLSVSEGTVIGQRWPEPVVANYEIFDKYCRTNRDRITLESIFMYPYIMHTTDIRRTIERYVELSYEIRSKENKWESDMYALIIVAAEYGLQIKTKDSLGVCSHWPEYNHSNQLLGDYSRPEWPDPY